MVFGVVVVGQAATSSAGGGLSIITNCRRRLTIFEPAVVADVKASVNFVVAVAAVVAAVAVAAAVDLVDDEDDDRNRQRNAPIMNDKVRVVVLWYVSGWNRTTFAGAGG